MIDAIPQYSHISEQEYYWFEERAEVRHEYLDGEIFDMAGGTPTHARLISSVTIALGRRLLGHPCYFANSDQRIKVERTGLITYPDAAIVCPPERYDPANANTLLNPRVVVEVLSPGTEEYDRRIKLKHYYQIDSLTHIILVRQDRIQVEHHHREPGGDWTTDTHGTRTSILRLRDFSLEVPLNDIYAKLDLPELSE
jgi:Uma2 family endonuclease